MENDDRTHNPKTVYRVTTFTLSVTLGFIASITFLLSWPAALYIGWFSHRQIMRSRMHYWSTSGYLFLSFSGIVIGQMPLMLIWSLGLPVPFSWALLTPIITGLLYLSGVALAAFVTAIRKNPSDTVPPTSDDHGSSAQPHKHNPTPSERRNGHMRTIIVRA